MPSSLQNLDHQIHLPNTFTPFIISILFNPETSPQPTSMLNSTQIHADVYNTLPEIEEHPALSADVLSAIGDLFTSHGVQDIFGVSLLHRHFLLNDGEVMVHKGLRCGPEMMAEFNSPLRGRSFFLQDDGFQAFEYDEEDTPAIDGGFLHEFRGLLVAQQLDKIIALSKLDQAHPRLMEQCDDGRGHMCEEYNGPISIIEATEWRFDFNNDFVVPVVVRGCARTSSGDHKKKES